MHNQWLHRFAIFTAVNTFVLIFIGGLVTSTGSGLSVPDWPTTYGENMFTYPIDKWVGGIKYEHGHRLFASYVGLLTVILSVWISIHDDRKWVKLAGFTALTLVIVQGLLGGLTVLFLLPTPVSIAHGMMAQTFLCLVSAIALFTSPWWKNTQSVGTDDDGRSLLKFAWISSVAVFLQLAFGALLRHTYSGMAVPDFPLAYGQIFPSLSPDSITQYNHQLIQEKIKWAGDRPLAAYQIIIHLIHRYWAYGVAGIILFTGYRMTKNNSLPSHFKNNGYLLIGAVLTQFIFGMLTVLSRKEILITTAHVALGAFTLVVCVITTLQLSKILGIYRKQD